MQFQARTRAQAVAMCHALERLYAGLDEQIFDAQPPLLLLAGFSDASALAVEIERYAVRSGETGVVALAFTGDQVGLRALKGSMSVAAQDVIVELDSEHPLADTWTLTIIGTLGAVVLICSSDDGQPIHSSQPNDTAYQVAVSTSRQDATAVAREQLELLAGYAPDAVLERARAVIGRAPVARATFARTQDPHAPERARTVQAADAPTHTAPDLTAPSGRAAAY